MVSEAQLRKGRHGRKGMEQTITKAGRVRRQMKAGRRRTVRSLNVYEALGLVVNQADKARNLMHDAGLDPDDVSVWLIIRLPDAMLSLKRLPAPGNTKSFFDAVAGMEDAEFLGALWQQIDRDIESNGKPLRSYWITPFLADPKSQQQMKAIHEAIKAGGTQLLAN